MGRINWKREAAFSREAALNAEKAMLAAEDERDQLRVQLAGCLVAADGHISEPAMPGDYGWSVAYQRVVELRQWVADLQSEMYINCVYCGHRYGPAEDTPVAMAEVLRQHIEQCPQHPASKMRERAERAEALLEIERAAARIQSNKAAIWYKRYRELRKALGAIVDVYDKRAATAGEMDHYNAGAMLDIARAALTRYDNEPPANEADWDRVREAEAERKMDIFEPEHGND